MNTFAIGSLPVHFSVAKLFTFRWQYTQVVNNITNGMQNPEYLKDFVEEQKDINNNFST